MANCLQFLVLVWAFIYVHAFGNSELPKRNIYMPVNNPHAPLEVMVKHYDPVYFGSQSDNTYRAARHTRDLSSANTLKVHLSSMNRTFHLSMYPHTTLFDKEFGVIGIGSTANETFVGLDKKSFMQGHLLEKNGYDMEPESHVSMHVDEFGIITGHIYSNDELFVVEPARRHFRDIVTFPMIMYRWSDINHDYYTNENLHDASDEYGFCGAEKEDIRNVDDESVRNIASGRSFSKREQDSNQSARLAVNNNCRVSLVADYNFFSNVGQSSPSVTVNFIVSVMLRVDTIYARQKFPNLSGNIRLSVRRVLYYTQPDNNPYAGDFTAIQLLNKFKETNWDDSCLAHLFTHREFSKGKLGLAVIGKASSLFSSGICAKHIRISGVSLNNNVGLTTTYNNGGTILISIIDTTVAHEIAHGFGSDHDSADDPICSPPTKYIMSASTQSFASLGKNSYNFSPCSLSNMEAVIIAKGTCLSPKLDTSCGNRQLEMSKLSDRDEQCDVGLQHFNDDVCCNDDCQLKEGKMCSPANYICCGEDCQAANATKLCSRRDNLSCNAKSYCNGTSLYCPDPPPVQDGVICRDEGVCENGMCKSFCHFFNAEPCVCPKDECAVCCKSKPYSVGSRQIFSDTCQHPADVNLFASAEFVSLFRHLSRPYRPLVTNATPCTGGLCNAGRCILSLNDDIVVDEPLEQAIMELGSWMSDFVVPTILIFSLLAVFPYYFVLRYRNLDAKEKKELKDQVRTFISEKAQHFQNNKDQLTDQVWASLLETKRRMRTSLAETAVYLQNNITNIRRGSRAGELSQESRENFLSRDESISSK